MTHATTQLKIRAVGCKLDEDVGKFKVTASSKSHLIPLVRIKASRKKAKKQETSPAASSRHLRAGPGIVGKKYGVQHAQFMGNRRVTGVRSERRGSGRRFNRSVGGKGDGSTTTDDEERKVFPCYRWGPPSARTSPSWDFPLFSVELELAFSADVWYRHQFKLYCLEDHREQSE